MTNLVPADQIERIVGVARDPIDHWARAVSAEQTVYILHSQQCKDSTPDLRDCPFSLALDDGIEIADWVEDEPVIVSVEDGRLVPWVAA